MSEDEKVGREAAQAAGAVYNVRGPSGPPALGLAHLSKERPEHPITKSQGSD